MNVSKRQVGPVAPVGPGGLGLPWPWWSLSQSHRSRSSLSCVGLPASTVHRILTRRPAPAGLAGPAHRAADPPSGDGTWGKVCLAAKAGTTAARSIRLRSTGASTAVRLRTFHRWGVDATTRTDWFLGRARVHPRRGSIEGRHLDLGGVPAPRLPGWTREPLAVPTAAVPGARGSCCRIVGVRPSARSSVQGPLSRAGSVGVAPGARTEIRQQAQRVRGGTRARPVAGSVVAVCQKTSVRAVLRPSPARFCEQARAAASDWGERRPDRDPRRAGLSGA